MNTHDDEIAKLKNATNTYDKDLFVKSQNADLIQCNPQYNLVLSSNVHPKDDIGTWRRVREVRFK